MIGDPYEEADNERLDDARLVAPQTPKKSRKIFIAAMVLVGTLLAVVVLANIAGLVTGKASDSTGIPKPLTMTRQQSDSFAQQQSGQAAFLKGMDTDKNSRNNEDTVLGYGKGLASDTLQEVDGIPRKTQAQDDAMRGSGNGGTAKSEMQIQRERAEAEAIHRRQNDLDSSPVALDFSDYFAKQKEVALAARLADHETPETRSTQDALDTLDAQPPDPPQRRRSAIADAINIESDAAQPAETVPSPATAKNQPHNPSQDYVFDSSFGKLYRLMEDTILETVLVNRLAGAAVGPVITMITTDVYSASGSHLLIPKGTRLLGNVSAVASLNQERLFVAFHRMIMPDGYSVSLDKFKGLDVVGQTGLRDLVNHHYGQIFGASLALAAVAATAQIGNNSSFGTYDWGVQMRGGMSQEMGQSAQRVMDRFLNILPTFTVRERSRVKIMLAGDLLLPDTKNHTMDPDL
jgi:type IV secretory pathway VirB10-like protein